jgi:AraC family transcriptional regulator of adaptative response/methylated-DNA-[protein]-cysteine methyltransferase
MLMTMPEREKSEREKPVALANLKRDYDRIADAIAYLERRQSDQPTLEEVAAHVGLSPFHFQRLFSRWAGISPKQFLGVLTHAFARELLLESHSVLDVAFETGLSGPSRVHDLFVTHEAMSPGEVKQKGAGLDLVYGFHPSPFGEALFIVSDRGLAGLAFADENGGDVLNEMMGRWPKADYTEDSARVGTFARRIFGSEKGPVPLLLSGTNFQVRVWEALLAIPPGRLTTYEHVADTIGNASAVRAVGTAVGRNPISYVIPCHRVLRKSGALGGYHWGLVRKKAMIGWEQGRVSA